MKRTRTDYGRLYLTDATADLVLTGGATIGVTVLKPGPDGRYPAQYRFARAGARLHHGDGLDLSPLSDGDPMAAMRALLDFAEFYRDGGDGDPLTPGDRLLGRWYDENQDHVRDVQYPPEGDE